MFLQAYNKGNRVTSNDSIGNTNLLQETIWQNSVCFCTVSFLRNSLIKLSLKDHWRWELHQRWMYDGSKRFRAEGGLGMDTRRFRTIHTVKWKSLKLKTQNLDLLSQYATLFDRREQLCLNFFSSPIESERFRSWVPPKKSTILIKVLRNSNKLSIPRCRTSRCQKNPFLYMANLWNNNDQ